MGNDAEASTCRPLVEATGDYLPSGGGRMSG